jgi:hypothetical protein
MKMRTRRRNAMKSPARVAVNTTGPRCRTFSVGCFTCASWHHLDTYGHFPRNFMAGYNYNRDLEMEDALAQRGIVKPEMGLSQEYCRGLAVWFATRLSAKEDVRKAFPDQFNNGS